MDLSHITEGMKVVTVSGAQKGVGKTALAEILLSNLPGFAAIKITMTDLYTSVSEDENDIMSPDTDTYRMRKNGAEKVAAIQILFNNMQRITQPRNQVTPFGRGGQMLVIAHQINVEW